MNSMFTTPRPPLALDGFDACLPLSQWSRYAQYGKRTFVEWLAGEDWQTQPHPIFLHKPKGTPQDAMTLGVWLSFKRLSRDVVRNRRRVRYRQPAHLTFLTYSTYNRKRLIEKCYDAYGLAYVLLRGSRRRWSWFEKIRLVLEFLDSARCHSDYIVATDANDVLLVNDPNRIVDYFETYGCDALFCNSVADWPPTPKYREFESATYPMHPLHSHLSAGAYLGRREALVQHLREIVSAYETRQAWAFTESGSFDDQLSWRHLHSEYYPKIKVDHRSLIFKRYDLFRHLDY